MSYSRKKMEVGARIMPEWDGKRWVKVRMLKSNEWIPSFEDLYRIVRAIAFCEDEKYPPPAKGRQMVAEFLVDCIWVPKDLTQDGFTMLRDKYQIPERCGIGVQLEDDTAQASPGDDAVR